MQVVAPPRRPRGTASLACPFVFGMPPELAAGGNQTILFLSLMTVTQEQWHDCHEMFHIWNAAYQRGPAVSI